MKNSPHKGGQSKQMTMELEEIKTFFANHHPDHLLVDCNEK